MGNIVQVKNPKSGLYVRINKATGNITGHKRTPGPYKNVPVARKRTIKASPKAPGSFTRGKARSAVKSTFKAPWKQ
jgi:hypothetical protein